MTQSNASGPASGNARRALVRMRTRLQAAGVLGFRRGSAWRGVVSVSYLTIGILTLLAMRSPVPALVFAAGAVGILVLIRRDDAIDRARVRRLNAQISAPNVTAVPARPNTGVAFWGSVAGVFFVGCVAWAAGVQSIWQRAAAPSAGTSAVAAPTVEAAAQVSTPVPQATPTPQGQAAAEAAALRAAAAAAQARRTALYGYIGTVTQGLFSYGNTLGTLAVLTAQAGNAPLVASSDDWKLKTATATTALRAMAAQMAVISPVPPEMAEVASLITQLNGETQLMSDDLTPGAGTLEAARLVSVTMHLERINRLSRTARDIMIGYTGGRETVG